MSAKTSESLMLVWRIAELQARQLNAGKIEPYHLLLAISKIVDLDLTTIVPKDVANRDEILEQLLREIRRIRTIFRVADFDAKTLRRTLRKTVPGNPEKRFVVLDSEPLHRSAATRKLFAEAQHFAELSDQTVYPVHLLLAVLCTQERCGDDVMRELGIDKKRLEKIAKREIFTARPTGFSLGGESKRGRN
jgi:ATP-dependent Clp protease ATP-binding subunit ClpA